MQPSREFPRVRRRDARPAVQECPRPIRSWAARAALANTGGLDAALRRALREGRTRLDFQPMWRSPTGATEGF